MSTHALDHLFENNRAWARDMVAREPDFFTRRSGQQAPEYLWIGCADSRVSATQVIGLMPGEIFVHRNVSNVVVHTDLNCLSVLQFAVDVLHVKHVIVCGHYGCGGVQATLAGAKLGLIDNWLRHVHDVALKHADALAALNDAAKLDRLCELNVIEQVANVAQTTVVQDAWERGQKLAIHGWVYGLKDGLVRDLRATVTRAEDVLVSHENAVASLNQGGA
ncbi:MAG TPA: carbonate dehydratase [Gammaproteobacteria bacterium]|nr:carbonate dehydratase [Gammaproteobacteria bacterium]